MILSTKEAQRATAAVKPLSGNRLQDVSPISSFGLASTAISPRSAILGMIQESEWQDRNQQVPGETRVCCNTHARHWLYVGSLAAQF